MTTPRSEASLQSWVPVVSSTGQPLMPCRPVRARKLVEQGRAIKKWRNRFFYIQVLDIVEGKTQSVAIGIDPGSKMEGYTVKSAHRTFLNLQSHARNGKMIQKSLETRANARRARRSRKTPCRQPRWVNRSRVNWLPPSTRARWQLKLNIIRVLQKLYPITHVIVEDVRTELKSGEKRRNVNFSFIQVGKHWFYRQLESFNLELSTISGRETAALRRSLGLIKTMNKLATLFSAHCVDSWVMANSIVNGHVKPDLTQLLILKPLVFTRRQLHRFNPSQGGYRSRYGGTMSLGLKRGTLITHPKYGHCLIGGNDGVSRLSLHAQLSLSRLCRNAKLEEIVSISYSPWVISGQYNLPVAIKQEHQMTRQLRYTT